MSVRERLALRLADCGIAGGYLISCNGHQRSIQELGALSNCQKLHLTLLALGTVAITDELQYLLKCNECAKWLNWRI